MSTPNKTPRGKGRPWIPLYTTFLGDTDLLLAGQNARTLVPLLLLHTADQGLCGLVPSDPRAVQLFAHYDHGVSAVRDALTALVEAGFLVDSDRAGFYLIRTWGRYQTDLGGSQTRSAAAAASALLRWHREGKHVGDADDRCGLCNGDVVQLPAGPAAAAENTTASQAATYPAGAQAPPIEVPDEVPDVRTMAGAVAYFRSTIADSLAAAVTPFAGYMQALRNAQEFAVTVGDLSGDALGALNNEVLAHAFLNFLGQDTDHLVIAASNKGAKALGTGGHRWYVHAALLGASEEFKSNRHAIGWLRKVALSERAKNTSGVSA